MVVANDRDAVFPFCIGDRERAIEIDVTVVEGAGEKKCVGMQWRDDIGSGREVLGSKC
jgi:hypothetical protein